VLDRVRSADGLASRLDPDLPVIVLTGRSGEADRVRSFARGADAHLAKPTCPFPPRVIPARAVAVLGLLGGGRIYDLASVLSGGTRGRELPAEAFRSVREMVASAVR
jgi:DNA-binding response OmpR family regulator